MVEGVKVCAKVNELYTVRGLTALHSAAAKGHVKTIQSLLKAGLKPNQKTNMRFGGFTPLYLAFMANQLEAVLALLEGVICEGVKICADIIELKKDDREIALRLAAAKGHAKLVKVFLEAGIDPNCMSKELETPLYLACQAGQEAAAKALLEGAICWGVKHCARINERNKKAQNSGAIDGEQGTTALQVAIQQGHAGVVTLLISQGANYPGKVPSSLIKAVVQGHEKRAVFFLEMLSNQTLSKEDFNSLCDRLLYQKNLEHSVYSIDAITDLNATDQPDLKGSKILNKFILDVIEWQKKQLTLTLEKLEKNDPENVPNDIFECLSNQHQLEKVFLKNYF